LQLLPRVVRPPDNIRRLYILLPWPLGFFSASPRKVYKMLGSRLNLINSPSRLTGSSPEFYRNFWPYHYVNMFVEVCSWLNLHWNHKQPCTLSMKRSCHHFQLQQFTSNWKQTYDAEIIAPFPFQIWSTLIHSALRTGGKKFAKVRSELWTTDTIGWSNNSGKSRLSTKSKISNDPMLWVATGGNASLIATSNSSFA